ncbi:DUF4232 domain-containing protein [Streptomyces sp. NPDC093093]|uniref:DUF4232 domain-containing protein n=1 Tax=Streptomyces sp. NPDC093093 TaxID=3366025 RepID=UPI00380354A5
MEWAVPPAKDDSKLLLTVTNTGTKPCKLHSHPVLRLENGHGRLVGVGARLPTPCFPASQPGPAPACPFAHSPTQANSSPSSSGPRGIGAGR